MYALIETVGKRATIWFEQDKQGVDNFMIQWYNTNVKMSKIIDWKHTWIEVGEYARVYNFKSDKELRVAVV